MKKTVSFLLSILIVFPLTIVSYAENEVSVSAKSAVVVCADTLEVVYSKNMNEKLPMASTTKIMTSILALEYGASEDYITVTDEMVKIEGTSMGLRGGDSVSLKTLVKGMLLASGNDSANSVACIVGGNIPDFVSMMNAKAKEIGMNSTSFETPSGLDGENHYSTAYDMALLGAYAINNPEFRSICSSAKEVVYYGNPPYRRTMSNHNKLLSYCDGAFGIKTGFTKRSGRCLVSAVERDGKTLVAVTLNDPNDWDDHMKMYDYSFKKVNSQELTEDLFDIKLPVVGGEKSSIEVEFVGTFAVTTISENYQYTDRIYLKQFEYAPIEKGEIVGYIEFYDTNGKKIAELPICASESVEAVSSQISEKNDDKKKNIFERIIEFFR